MSDNIPFEIQSEIIKWLPVKSFIRFRSVSKSWKSLIDSSDFIARYSGQQQHLLVRYKDAVNFEEKYVSIVDDHTFPQQKVSVTVPPLVSMLKRYRTIGYSHGLFCLSNDDTAVLWNPSICKAVAVTVPNMADNDIYETVLGFGVCRETNDPKIVKINHINSWSDIESLAFIPLQVELFTLSTGAWRSLSSNLPRNSIKFGFEKAVTILFGCDQVVIDGCLYWLAQDRIAVDDTFTSYDLIISFDTTSEEFGEVNLPDSVAHAQCSLSMYKLRESLVVIETRTEDFRIVNHVWMLEDDAPKMFKKLFTIRSSHSPDVSIVCVRGVRKTGEPLVELLDHSDSARILAAYEPYSKSISNVGINGRPSSYYVYSYMETLLLL